MLNYRPPSKPRAGCSGFCNLAILSTLSVFFYIYGYNSPDQAGCWIGIPMYNGVATSESRVVWPDETHPYYKEVTLEDAVDWGHKFTLWFRMGFFLFVIQGVFMLIRMIGQLTGNKGLSTCGGGVAGCGNCFAFVMIILGCVWRWGENGTLASCYKMSCTDGKGEPNDLLGSGYQYKAGKFMNIYIWIYLACAALPLACCLLCLPICCVMMCCAAKK